MKNLVLTERNAWCSDNVYIKTFTDTIAKNYFNELMLANNTSNYSAITLRTEIEHDSELLVALNSDTDERLVLARVTITETAIAINSNYIYEDLTNNSFIFHLN